MFRFLISLILLSCTNPPVSVPTPSPEVPIRAVKTYNLVGSLNKIEFSNIDKSGNNPKFNVELLISPESIEPKLDSPAELIRVRLPDRLYWKKLTKAEQKLFQVGDAEGAGFQINAAEYSSFREGESVELEIYFTSHGLAHLNRRNPAD